MEALDTPMGNKSNLDVLKVQNEFSDFLVDGERVQHAYELELDRSKIIFTDKRLIVAKKQLMVANRAIEYMSIPYDKVTHFSISASGHFGLNADLKVWVSGGTPVELNFNKMVNIYEIERILAANVF